jgi:hypothetical protein
MARPNPARSRILCGAAVSVALLSAHCLAQIAQFSDQTVAAGVACSHTSVPTDVALVMSAGGAVGDFNNDGWQDLFVLGGYGAPDKLFINNHDGTFSEQGAAWGVAAVHRGMGVAVGDYNNDGWLDIFVTVDPGNGTALNLLYRNNGNGTFTEVAQAAGLAFAPGRTVGGGFGAAWGDYDLDGRLDLAIADWFNTAGGNRLYHNNGDGTFTNVTTSALGGGLNVQGFSPRFVDMNGDRYPELLWVADYGGSKYFVNNGNGTFTNRTSSAGVGLEGNGMGTIIADVNGDGRPDWFVTSIYSPDYYPGTGNMLYINQGNGSFSEVSAAAGVKQGGWGWGAVAADFNNDGREDLAHVAGYPETGFTTDPPRVFINTGSNAFQQIAPGCGISSPGTGRGMAVFDYNNDGAMDVVIFNNGGPLKLYRNDLVQGPGTAWLRVFLDTRAAGTLAPNGYGAHVTATANGIARHRWITGGSNYLSQSELSAHFGLGSATAIDRLRIDWPDGRVTEKRNLAINQTIRVSPCTADFNVSGTVTVQDIFDYLNAWFGGDPMTDVDASGVIEVQDIFDFLNAWFVGC